jgi:hypothetical protein
MPQRDIQLPYASSVLSNICSLRSLLPFSNFELDGIALLQALVAFGSNRAVMHKNVGTIRASDESVALCVIEPLYCSFQSFHA